MRSPNLIINKNRERRIIPTQRPGKYFNKIKEEKFPNLKKEIPIKVQGAYRTEKSLNEKINLLSTL